MCNGRDGGDLRRMTRPGLVLLFIGDEVGRHLATAASADCVREVKGVIMTNPTWKPPSAPGSASRSHFPHMHGAPLVEILGACGPCI